MTIQGFAIASTPSADPCDAESRRVRADPHLRAGGCFPAQADVDAFLPPFRTPSKMDLEAPTNMGFTAGQRITRVQVQQHRAILRASGLRARWTGSLDAASAPQLRRRGGALSLRGCGRGVVTWHVAGIVRETVDRLRARGVLPECSSCASCDPSLSARSCRHFPPRVLSAF